MNSTACYPLAAWILAMGMSSAHALPDRAMAAEPPAADEQAAEEAVDEELLTMIGELIRDADREMRGLGLQHVREQLPGQAATEWFTALLPSLSPESQAALLEALGDRGDATARPAVLQMLDSSEASVRAAALGALGSLGSAQDVPLLAAKAAGDAGPERSAAAASLVRLRGDDMDGAIVAALESAQPAARGALLNALGGRNARAALPSVLAGARAPEPEVHLPALGALRLLAEADEAAELVAILKAAPSDAARGAAQLALLTVCRTGGESCTPALRQGLEQSDEAAQIALLRVLARAGGPDALEAVVDRYQDGPPAVRIEALRILSLWSDPAIVPRLLEIAGSAAEQREKVLAIRGLIRVADARGDQPADPALLKQALQLSERPQERRLVLAALSRATSPDALATVVELLADGQLAEEAAHAAVAIAERLDKPSAPANAALRRVLEVTENPVVRERAQKTMAGS